MGTTLSDLHMNDILTEKMKIIQKIYFKFNFSIKISIRFLWKSNMHLCSTQDLWEKKWKAFENLYCKIFCSLLHTHWAETDKKATKAKQNNAKLKVWRSTPSLLTCAGENVWKPGCDRISSSRCEVSDSRKEAPNWGSKPLSADSSEDVTLLMFSLLDTAGINQDDSCSVHET